MLAIGASVVVVAVLMNFLLIPIFGYSAAAYVALFCYVSYAIATMLVGRRFVAWQFNWIRIASTSLLIGCGVVLSSVVRSNLEAKLGYRYGLGGAAVVILIPTIFVVARVMRAFLSHVRFTDR